jgi:RNA polymerase sigma factor (sigma-70 family)
MDTIGPGGNNQSKDASNYDNFGGSRVPMAVASMSSHELFFACLRSGEESAWVEFVRRFNPLIARVAFRVARQWGESSPQVIEDLVQETYLKMCAERFNLVEKFQPRHDEAVFGFIKVFTANLAIDHFRAAKSHKRGSNVIKNTIDDQTSTEASISTSSFSNQLDRNVLVQQIQECLQTTAAGPFAERDRRIFWLYYRVGLTAGAIASIPAIGLSTKGVESTLLRITRDVRGKLADKRHGSSVSS